MAKKVYIGVDGKAKRVNKIYVGTDNGGNTKSSKSVWITSDNISKYFIVENGPYYYKGNEYVFTSTEYDTRGTSTTVLTAKYDMPSLTFDYRGEGEERRGTLFKVIVGNKTVVSNYAGGGTYNGSIQKGQQISFEYKSNGYNFRSSFSYMKITAEVDVGTGVAKRIKKGYIGVAGVARPVFSSDELIAYGTITPLSVARDPCPANIGGYALLAGGTNQFKSDDYRASPSDKIDVYDNSLIKTESSLSVSRYSIKSGLVGDYALFAGGYTNNPTYPSKVVDAINKSLVRSTPTQLNTAKSVGGGSYNNNYAIFVGGYYAGWVHGNPSMSYYQNEVEAYNKSLVKSQLSNVSGYTNVGTAKVGSYALFAGSTDIGSSDPYLRGILAYSDSLVKSSTSMSVARTNVTGVSTEDYALFAGGTGDDYYSTVDAINASLVRVQVPNLSVPRYGMGGTSVKGYAMFAGGREKPITTGDDKLSMIVDAYTKDLVKTKPMPLLSQKRVPTGVSTENYALFAGGYYGYEYTNQRIYKYSNVVDAYAVG